MDAYDEDDGGAGPAAAIFGGGAAYYASNKEDPYMALARGTRGAASSSDDDDGASDDDDWDIRPTDLLLASVRSEDDVSALEVWVCEAGGEDGGPPNVYVHHDVLLAAFPLCAAWLDCAPGGASGSFVAVGTMDPGVEVWDLGAADAVEPAGVLGPPSAAPGATASGERKKGARAAKPARPASGGHTDAVLGLAWNAEYRNVLASASADETVVVWDVAAAKAAHALTHHTSKVQAVAWNPADAPVLLSGGFDRRAVLADVRAPGAAAAAWTLGADVEALAWDPAQPTHFYASTEDGVVAAVDARAGPGAAPLFRLAAHDRPTSALAFCPHAPGLLATASTDKRVKLWDVAGGAPSLVASQDLKVGALFTVGFCADAPGMLAAGGAKGTVAVWDVTATAAVQRRWAKTLGPRRGAAAAEC